MPTSTDLRQDSFGFYFEAQLLLDGEPANLSGASLLELHLEKPDGTTHVRLAELKTNGLDGRVRYLVANGDLDQAGSWRRQFLVETPQLRFPLAPVAFEVTPNIIP